MKLHVERADFAVVHHVGSGRDTSLNLTPVKVNFRVVEFRVCGFQGLEVTASFCSLCVEKPGSNSREARDELEPRKRFGVQGSCLLSGLGFRAYVYCQSAPVIWIFFQSDFSIGCAYHYSCQLEECRKLTDQVVTVLSRQLLWGIVLANQNPLQRSRPPFSSSWKPRLALRFPQMLVSLSHLSFLFLLLHILTLFDDPELQPRPFRLVCP